MVPTGSIHKAEAASLVAYGQCGNDLFWNLNSDGVLEFTGTGEFYWNFFFSKVPWFDYRNQIVSLVVNDGVTEVYGLEDCPNLTSVTLGNTVKYIEGNAFYKDSNLTQIILPSSITYIGKAAFSYTGLTSVAIVDYYEAAKELVSSRK